MDWSSEDDVRALIERLVRETRELPWLEFKVGNANPEELAEYVSCLANSAALEEREAAFMLWGIDDATHDTVGTDFDPWTQKKGSEDLIPWLTRAVDPQVELRFGAAPCPDGRVVVLRVEAAHHNPVKFKGRAFIRVDSYKKLLTDNPEYERRLWKRLGSKQFERGVALDGLEPGDVTQLLDYPAFFTLQKTPLPENRSQILETMAAAGLIRYDVESQWQITLGGALLYARDIRAFQGLERKAPRVIHYDGTSRIRARREQVGQRGYASGFRGLIAFITDQLPNNEVIETSGIRLDELLYPQLAIRELVANALIHQDLSVAGSGPMIEIFEDRMEITNPGVPLMDPLRFIDLPPQSRNEFMGAAMRQVGIAEERGSGWDKIAFQIELHQLPPARVEVFEAQTRVTLFAPKPLSAMDKQDRVLAVYQHACLRYVSNQPTNNGSIRERFGIQERNKAQASRILKEAVEAGLVVPHDPTAGPRSMRYVPFWADPQR